MTCSDTVSGINSDILSGKILTSRFVFLCFSVAWSSVSSWAYHKKWALPDIDFDIVSDIDSDILSDIHSDIESDINFQPSLLSDIRFDILSEIQSDILSDIHADTYVRYILTFYLA